MIREDISRGQRIEAFALEARDGAAWKEIARGTTVGYKKLLRFPAVETAAVRLRVLRVRSSRSVFRPIVPPLSFGLFLDPER